MFRDRKDAGRKLALLLARKYKDTNCVVLGLPRGGVVVAYEIAKTLHAPLGVIVTRKIGHPYESEYAIAALTQYGTLVHDTDEIEKISQIWLAKEIIKEQREIQRRLKLYGKENLSIDGARVFLVDDGAATGLTMKAAIADAKIHKPKEIIIVVPVIAQETYNMFQKEVDNLVVLRIVAGAFGGIGNYYQKFPQVTDVQVLALLKKKTV